MQELRDFVKQQDESYVAVVKVEQNYTAPHREN
jgi:hypothetical protein